MNLSYIEADCGVCGRRYSHSVTRLTTILQCSHCHAESRIPESVLEKLRRSVPVRVHPVFGEISQVYETGWEGILEVECGDVGIFPLKFQMDEFPTELHAANFAQLVERWPLLWRGVSALLIRMLQEYGREQDLGPLTTFLELHVPGEPIESGAEWSIAVTLFPSDGIWIIPFRGWEILEDQAQPMF